MKRSKLFFGKMLYAFLFLGILPLILYLWAIYTEHIIRFPAIDSITWGIVISIVGGMLMIWGMFALAKYGKGLPMNAFPPPKLVKEGPYKLLRHPIYWGFGFLVVGFSLIFKSAGGLWLVSPVTILGMIALVWGYENISLKQRFTNEKISAYLDIPGKGTLQARFRDRFSSLFWVLSFFLLGNALVFFLVGDTVPLLNESWKFLGIADGSAFYIFGLIFVFGVPLVVKKQNLIREWTISMLIAIALSIYISLLWPDVGTQYFPQEFSLFNSKLTLLIILKGIPLFSVLLSLKVYLVQFKRIAFFFYLVSFILSIILLDNSRSSMLHLAISLLIFLISAYHFRIWILFKSAAEKIANSWKEWVFGPIRIINHGFYAGFAAFIGILLAGFLAGKNYAWGLLVFSVAVIIFSALWAQIIEGSEKLKRPFGYYGALVGIIFAGFLVWLMGYNVWVIIGVVSVLMPWVQAIGRLRCLVNGCCHGSHIEDATVGIRYFHYRSRVCGISSLKGKLLHPTPLYAILWLFFVGFILLALWNKSFPYSFIFGLYLILTGLGRFVEEAFRGEIQTPILKGLRLYQWTAIASILIGILMTTFPTIVEKVHPDIGWGTIIAALLGGLIAFIAMGVDFPHSNARFSRLV